MHILTQDTCS